ncbi:MAG: NitT/TauT family transport system ATP-binding protein [Thermomicrobiales bacterium]|nr:NitT/TauT family transport system ATP-binding protein [Thermomicrobiales bacterium]MEA2526546.1 NitT/TauT family transport system ATP-binding protein [Thermomicrobiales bacterium]
MRPPSARPPFTQPEAHRARSPARRLQSIADWRPPHNRLPLPFDHAGDVMSRLDSSVTRGVLPGGARLAVPAPDGGAIPEAAARPGPTNQAPVLAVPSLLELREIAATYIEGREVLPVLDGVSFTVGEGEFVALIGPSGSGKSTLLDIVAGLIAPDVGEVLLAGQPLPTPERLGRTAYMRQRDLLLPWRTALDNAALALEVAGMPRRRARAIARTRLSEFGLEGFADAYPAQLSGGMRQRVAFLRTVLAGPPLLLLDEPFGALDALTRAAMQDWLLGLLTRERRTVLLVTHDVEEAVFLADRVVVLSPRPAHVVHIEPVRVPRPRRRSIVTAPDFVAHKAAVLRALGLLDEAGTE